jgi:hypothetical protein
MVASEPCQRPHAWSTPGFSLDEFALVFLPGGHDKAVKQILDSATVHDLLAAYFPQTRRSGSSKGIGAICHGVLVLANTKDVDGKSVLSACSTTTLPARFEQVAFWGTRLFLGDYYKTYGAGSENVEDSVRQTRCISTYSSNWADGNTDRSKAAWTTPINSTNAASACPRKCRSLMHIGSEVPASNDSLRFVVEDEQYNYISARFPGDAEEMARKLVDLVKSFS